jgi:hypothetical protein
MTTIRGILGLIFLFLGRELSFVFAGGIAALFGFRLAPLLPAAWPGWADYAFIIGLAVLFAGLSLINDRVGYILSGFLGGGYVMSEYFAPGVAGIPILPFIAGSGIGALIMAFFNEWAMMIISSLIGAFFVVDLFRLRPELEMMISGGLFMLGALAQVVMRRMQQK